MQPCIPLIPSSKEEPDGDDEIKRISSHLRRWRRQGFGTTDERQRFLVQVGVTGTPLDNGRKDFPRPIHREAQIGYTLLAPELSLLRIPFRVLQSTQQLSLPSWHGIDGRF